MVVQNQGRVFFVSRLLRKYKSYFNKIIVIGSNLGNCENLQIKRDDTFNPLVDAFECSILVIYINIILNKKLISDAADILSWTTYENRYNCIRSKCIF